MKDKIHHRQFYVEFRRCDGDKEPKILDADSPTVRTHKQAKALFTSGPPEATHYEINQRVSHFDAETGWSTEWETIDGGVLVASAGTSVVASPKGDSL